MTDGAFNANHTLPAEPSETLQPKMAVVAEEKRTMTYVEQPRTRPAERAQPFVSCTTKGVHSIGGGGRRVAILLLMALLSVPAMGCAQWMENSDFQSNTPSYSVASYTDGEKRRIRRPTSSKRKRKRRDVRQRLARLVHEEANAVRQQEGLTALRWDPKLGQIAKGHSLDMARRDYFGHRSPDNERLGDRYKAARYQCRAPVGKGRYLGGGENLYVGFGNQARSLQGPGVTDAQLRALAKRIVKGWMNSPSHRKNLFHRAWRKEGIGISVDPEGKLYATQNFC